MTDPRLIMAGLILLAGIALVSLYRDGRKTWREQASIWTPPWGLAIALCLLALPARAQTIAWGSPTFSHGPTLAITEVSPSNPHPVSIAAGAGYCAALGFGSFSWLGKTWDLIDVGALVLGSVVSPNGTPGGGLQFGALIGALSNGNSVPFVSLAILNTPYTADGSGWAQGGRPGASFGLMGAIPL
ncbi:MAG: hypothetical protein ACYC6M_03055 [Terriglobales bacterium]